jgi:hypothetical protein
VILSVFVLILARFAYRTSAVAVPRAASYAQQKAMIALHSRTQQLRACGPALVCQPKRSRCVRVVAKSAVQLDTMKTAQTSEVTVLIPTEQPSMEPVRTQRQFGGISTVGALAAAALALGFVANRLRKRG